MSEESKWVVETRFLWGDWENVWHDGEEDAITVFNSELDAINAIREFFSDLTIAGMDDGYSLDDYRVRKLQNSPD